MLREAPRATKAGVGKPVGQPTIIKSCLTFQGTDNLTQRGRVGGHLGPCYLRSLPLGDPLKFCHHRSEVHGQD